MAEIAHETLFEQITDRLCEVGGLSPRRLLAAIQWGVGANFETFGASVIPGQRLYPTTSTFILLFAIGAELAVFA
jgi:hypothetical protein